MPGEATAISPQSTGLVGSRFHQTGPRLSSLSLTLDDHHERLESLLDHGIHQDLGACRAPKRSRESFLS